MQEPYMKIISGSAVFEFDSNSLPLLSRRPQTRRTSEQSDSMTKVDISLQGYFADYGEGQSMQSRYDRLEAACKSNSVRLIYFDGDQIVIDAELYVASVVQPLQWGQHVIDFSIDGYYFDGRQNSNHSSGIRCSYTSVSGAYSFDIIPDWSYSQRSGKSSQNSSTFLPSGLNKGAAVSIQLSGTCYAETTQLLESKRVAMSNAFSSDGILNYGNFSASVKIGAMSIPSVTPRTHFDFSIDMSYQIAGLTDFKATRTISRIHKNPIIHMLENCAGDPIVKERNPKGQTISYSLSAQGNSIIAIRSMLAHELSVLVFSGGTELPGGSEVWEEDPPSVSVNFQKFYKRPVVQNIES